MTNERGAVLEQVSSTCALCARSVLTGEPMLPFLDPRADRVQHVCELCRRRAERRGWSSSGQPARSSSRLRVEPIRQLEPEPEHELDPDAEGDDELGLRAQAAILERAGGAPGHGTDPDHDARLPGADVLLERIQRQDQEIQRLRALLEPARQAAAQQRIEQQSVQLRDLRAALQERDARVARLERARQAETSPMRMCGYALDAFNQSPDFERMSRIARTLGAPAANVRDEGAGIPRRLRLTLSWDIAWYEFVVKLDLGTGRASVHETGSGGDPGVLPVELRRTNVAWSANGLKLA